MKRRTFFLSVLGGMALVSTVPAVYAQEQDDPLADFYKKPCGDKNKPADFQPGVYQVTLTNLDPDYYGDIVPYNINTFGKAVNGMVGLPMETGKRYYFSMPQAGKLAIQFTPEPDHLGYHMVKVEVFRKNKAGELELLASNHAGFGCTGNGAEEQTRMRWTDLGLEVVMRRVPEDSPAAMATSE